MKISSTKEQITDLIAVMMVYCPACNCVSAPLIRAYPGEGTGANWETWDWRGEPDAIGPCQLALSEQIEGLKKLYFLGPVAKS